MAKNGQYRGDGRLIRDPVRRAFWLFRGLVVMLAARIAIGEEGPAEVPEIVIPEIVILSIFEVDTTKDDRYRATNSISATGLNTAIFDLPMTLSVVTNEFITDLGATDFEESLIYTPGVHTSDFEIPADPGAAYANFRGPQADHSPSASKDRGFFTNTVKIRGYGVPYQNRLGFRYGGLVITNSGNIVLGGIFDSVNTDRMEVVKGPNSILYGAGVISGIVNVIPKKPLTHQQNAFSVSTGSHDFLRLTGDITGPILRPKGDSSHGLNYRMVGALEQRGHWTDHRSKDLKYGAFQLEYTHGFRWKLFAEVQAVDSRFNGTGSQWIYDDLSNASDRFFRNAYDEQHNFAQDRPVAGLDKVIIEKGTQGRRVLLFSEPEIANRRLEGATLPDTTRLTGPDTYEQHRETDLLLDVTFNPSEQWTLSAGVFQTNTREEELAVNVTNMNNGEGRLRQIRNALPLLYEDLDGSEFAHLMYALKNESAEQTARDFNPALVQSFDDIKLGRYWWSLRPLRTESFQARVRSVLRFETPFISDKRTTNSLFLGYQYIKDKVDFLEGTEDLSRALLDRKHPYIESGRVSAEDAAKADALYFRAIDDFSVMRYEGRNLAMPGETYRNQEIGFHGAHAILQSRIWDDKVGLILGLRYDRYNAENREWNRISPEDEAIGLSDRIYVDNPFSHVYGLSEAKEVFDQDIEAWSKTIAVNYSLNPSLKVYGLYAEGLSPNTTLIDGNNRTIPAEKSRSIEAGVKWNAREGRLSGSLALFEIRRENAIWQFNRAPAPSKWAGSPNPPSGIIDDGAFNPEPDNGLLINYEVLEDFIPENVVGLHPGNLVTQSVDEPGRNHAWYIQDPVTRQLHRLYGLYDVQRRFQGPPGSLRRNFWALEYASLDHKQSIAVHVEDPEGTVMHGGRSYSLETIEINWRKSIEEAFAGSRPSGQISTSIPWYPIRYQRSSELTAINGTGNNPSALDSAAWDSSYVTFEDSAKGVDLELVYSPTGHLQFIFSYAHVERTPVGALEMVDWVDLNTGKAYGTEYDEIFRILGRENAGITGSDTDGDGVDDHFVDVRGNELSTDNPARPSDFASGLEELKLHFNPEDEASLWSRYTFVEGPLKNLGLAAGVRYTGPAQTSVPIGGDDLRVNLFRTPDTPERWNFDAAFYYGLRWLNADWRLSLNIYNLANDTESLATSEYTHPATGETTTKRTRLQFAPRSTRLGVAVKF